MKYNISQSLIIFIGLVLFSCSNDDDNGSATSSLQVNDEIWYTSQYFENVKIWHDESWSFDGGEENCGIEITKADEEGAILGDVLSLWAYSSSFPKLGEDLAKSSTFFAVRTINYMENPQPKFDYISGSAVITAINDDYVTVNLNNLKFHYDGYKSLPSYIPEELTVNGVIKCYKN